MGDLGISEVRLRPTTADDTTGGLLGFVSFVVNGALRLDGIALRLTRDGRHALSFPARRDRHGRRRAPVLPISDETRREIERQVFAALALRTEAPDSLPNTPWKASNRNRHGTE